MNNTNKSDQPERWLATPDDLRLDLHNKQKQILDLYALVDTLQTNLASAVTYLNEEDKETIVNVPSYKWCINWKQGDETK